MNTTYHSALASMDYEKALTDIPAPTPHNRQALCKLNIHPDTVKMHAEHRHLTKVFEMVYNICGVLPPVNNIGYHERSHSFPDHWGGVKHAFALFQGIKRPFQDDGLDGQVFVYVIKPRFYYEFSGSMVCVAKRKETPKGIVLAVYVKFRDSSYNEGTILSWDWVPADSNGLPDGHDKRYDKRLW